MRKADNLPPYCAVVTKSGNLNFLEPSGPVQACNGTDLTLPVANCHSVEICRIQITNRGHKSEILRVVLCCVGTDQSYLVKEV